MSGEIFSLLANRILNYFPLHFIKSAELCLLCVVLNAQQQCEMTMKWYLNFRWFGATDGGEVFLRLVFLFWIIQLHEAISSERITGKDVQITSGIKICSDAIVVFQKNLNNGLIKMCVVFMTEQQNPVKVVCCIV